MIRTIDEMTALVQAEIDSIADPVVRSAIQSLTVPIVKQQREQYEGEADETFACWLVIADTASDTGIVYSDYGFGPDTSWGLVFLSKLVLGDDSGWFTSLERAFYDSFAAADLRIWDLLKKTDDGRAEIIKTDLTMYEAYQEYDKLEPRIYSVEPRKCARP